MIDLLAFLRIWLRPGLHRSRHAIWKHLRNWVWPSIEPRQRVNWMTRPSYDHGPLPPHVQTHREPIDADALDLVRPYVRTEAARPSEHCIPRTAAGVDRPRIAERRTHGGRSRGRSIAREAAVLTPLPVVTGTTESDGTHSREATVSYWGTAVACSRTACSGWATVG